MLGLEGSKFLSDGELGVKGDDSSKGPLARSRILDQVNTRGGSCQQRFIDRAERNSGEGRAVPGDRVVGDFAGASG